VRRIRFHDDARLELVAQIDYYENEQPGRGARFSAAVEAAAALAASLPFVSATYKYGTRRVFTPKFPFSVVYVVQELEIVILAVAHFRRKPGYWRARKAGL
jgi:plasmid stabilization system protein ParE